MLKELLRHEARPCFGNRVQLGLAFLDGVLEEVEHVRAERVSRVGALLLCPMKSFQVRVLLRIEHPLASVPSPPPSPGGRGRTVHCKFTGMITYRKLAPPLIRPGRFGAVSSSVI